MQNKIKKYRGGILTLISAIIAFLSDEIKSLFLQLNIFLPELNIIAIIFILIAIIGIIIFIVDIFLNKQKSLENIKFYNSRNDLKSLKNMILQAKEEIIFIGATLEKITGEQEGTIKKAIENGVHMKFLLLDSESKIILELDECITGTKNAINGSLARICNIKSKLSESDKDKCEIKTYDLPLFQSIIIIDQKREDAMISVEFRLFNNDTDSRPSIYIYKKNKKELFEKYLKHYDFILKKSVEYKCKNNKKELK